MATRLPFGLDLKSLIVGIILALWVYPFVMQFWGKLRAKNGE